MSALGRLTIGAGCTDTVTFIPDFAAASFSTISHTRTDFYPCTIPATTRPLHCLVGVSANKMYYLSESLSNKSGNDWATLG